MVSCHKCQNRFTSKNDLKHHIDTVHKIENDKSKTKNKERILHVEEKIDYFYCDMCNFKDAQKACLKEHVEHVHDNNCD